MLGRTRLYQQPGSPLIQGNSRTEVPLWRLWIAGVAYGLLFAWVAGSLFSTYVTGNPGTDLWDAAKMWIVGLITLGLPGLLAGSWLGVVVSKGMGWSRPGLIAGILAAVLALLCAYLGLFVFMWSLPGL